MVLELTRKVCRKEPTQKSRFVRVLFSMLSSQSAAVSYEAAWTLVSLSSAPTAVRAAAVTYTNLLNGQNDNNIQLIVLERLEALKKKHSKILQELLMDILRALSSPNPDICKKVLEVAMDVVTARNVQEVVNTLKREVQKTMAEYSQVSSNEKSLVYRNMLVQAINDCAVKFPHVAESVVGVLLDLLGTDSSSLQVAIFVRAIMEQYPALRETLLPKLVDSISSISSNPVMCVCLWILGEYTEVKLLEDTFDSIAKEVGTPPFFLKEQSKKDAADSAAKAEQPKMVTKNVVLADGTYATQTSYTSAPKKPVDPLDSVPKLRRMILSGDVFLAETLSSCLTKLILKAQMEPTMDKISWKKRTADALLIMCGIVKMAEITITAQRSSLSDCQDRLTLCCRVLIDPKAQSLVKDIFLEDCKKQFALYLKTIKEKQQQESKKLKASEKAQITSQPDDLIHFRQLRSMAVQGGDVDLDDGSDLARATGYDNAGSLLSSELNHVYPLSGFADPVYCEALVTVHDYDIVLEIFVLNRTPHTLSNLTVELSTMGDMKIVERPQSHTIGPLDQMTIRASIKVSSTETGHIFGTIVYNDMSTKERCYIHLNDIHMDIMDYIRPATCTDEMFRSMWAEFEWENKVAIATSITSLVDFLNHIVSSTNMRCLTPHDGKSDKGSFLAANLYARR